MARHLTVTQSSYTLPVYFDQPVHPITLQLKTTLEKIFAVESAYFICDTAILTPVRTRGLKDHFAPLNRFFLKKNIKTKKNPTS
jgi:hypothetical protein